MEQHLLRRGAAISLLAGELVEAGELIPRPNNLQMTTTARLVRDLEFAVPTPTDGLRHALVRLRYSLS